jgi:hypothetical protein
MATRPGVLDRRPERRVRPDRELAGFGIAQLVRSETTYVGDLPFFSPAAAPALV